MGDETRINQVLINLLSNAVKYTQAGGNIWFRIIGLKQRSSQYEHIRIEVEDNGFGMAPEFLETIFDAFTRAENSTTNKVQGTGLGMAITKNIVELMGGTIEVSSQVDQGSIFRVELELRIPENQADKEFWQQNKITRIFAVNRDIELGKNIQMLMEDTGVQVEAYQSMEEVMGQIQVNSQCCHVIMIDWDSVDTEGILAAIRVREALPETTPILFLADYDSKAVEEALQINNTGILIKPFFVAALKEKIQELRSDLQGISDKKEKIENLEGMRFLAAEDNVINAEILSEILNMEGAQCEIAENGQLALERFTNAAEGEFDAILMDVQMPVMNGYEATRAIRALKRNDAKKIPIIAMTANAFAEDEKEALNAGMDVHLAKPIDIELLKKVINEHVKRKE